MYTVLLVDDENDVLENFKTIIDWPMYGIENVLTAGNGQEAYDIIRSQHIDLMITDISMPQMDGIQLFKRVHEDYPNIRCIFLSSYSDFTYAKEAISLGVENYLLKPIKVDELNSSIRKSLDNISMHKHIAQNLFLDNVLYRWITDTISCEELTERCRHVNINLYFRNYCVTMIRLKQRDYIRKPIATFISHLQAPLDTYHFIDYDGYHIFIIGGHHITQDYVKSMLTEAMQECGFQSDYLAAIGIIAEGSSNVPLSYQSTLDTLQIHQNAVGQYIACAKEAISIEISEFQLNQIIVGLTANSEHTEENDFEDLFRLTFENFTLYPLEEINYFINIFPLRLIRHAISIGQIDANAELGLASNAYHFEEFPTEKELYKWFTNVLSFCQILIRQKANRLSPVILHAMQYVADNYATYVSIKDFCARHNMNASYLGFIFKKETGVYFNDYITQLRINRATNLLKSSNYKISKISDMVGFTNTSYFIACFKKQIGISPVRYRQLYTKEKNNEERIS